MYGSLEASPDDENGYGILYGSSKNNEIAMDGIHDRDGEMASTAIRLARGKVAAGMARGRRSIDGDGVYLRWELFRRRVDYQRQTGRLLWESGAVVRVREEEMYMEYVPYIREMVLYGMGGGEGRVTRNSNKKGGWEVVRVLGSNGQKAMAGTGLTDG